MALIRKAKADDRTMYTFWCEGCDEYHKVNDSWDVDLKTNTISPSILVNSGGANPKHPICHSFVRNGEIEYLSDSTHKLAGKTVKLTEGDY